MIAFFTALILVFAEAAGQEGGGFMEWWYKNADPVLNYPGFEVWRFINLGIFVAIMVYLLKKPLSEAFKAKRDAIRADLIKAEEEKKAATAQLEAAQQLLEGLDSEKEKIIKNAESEGKAERTRIEREAEADIQRAEAQVATELSRKLAQVNVQLRRYSAQESVRLAEEKIRKEMNTAKDTELVRANVASIGGSN